MYSITHGSCCYRKIVYFPIRQQTMWSALYHVSKFPTYCLRQTMWGPLYHMMKFPTYCLSQTMWRALCHVSTLPTYCLSQTMWGALNLCHMIKSPTYCLSQTMYSTAVNNVRSLNIERNKLSMNDNLFLFIFNLFRQNMCYSLHSVFSKMRNINYTSGLIVVIEVSCNIHCH